MSRKDTPFTNEHFVEFCKAMVGQPYWYGCVMYPCTESRLQSKKKQYPAHYTSGRMSIYRQHIAKKLIAADCVGGGKGYAWTNGGQGVLAAIGTGKAFANQYASHGCPDTSANGMFSYAKSKGMEWGSISSLPETLGLALRFDGHIGYYIGKGYAIEWRGFAYGCVITKVKERPWTHWYKLPFIDYGTADKKTYTFGDRAIKQGMEGADVKELQETFNALGYRLGVDGVCGIQTVDAIIDFKTQRNIISDGGVTGTFGKRAFEALAEALAENEDGGDEPAFVGTFTVRVNEAGTWNVRTGPGTSYDRVTIVRKGDMLKYISVAENGWFCVMTNKGIGWISNKCAEVLA